MPIQLKCPNGHNLTAKESNAGKTGKCPVCKAAVRIPTLNQSRISDSAVINILGDPNLPQKNRVGTTLSPTKTKPVPIKAPRPKTADSPSSSSISMPHIKVCPSCEREIDMGYHICPFCHTYITGLNDF